MPATGASDNILPKLGKHALIASRLTDGDPAGPP
jgi:hypothetical protein